jgi:hypothetical protein
MIGTGTFPPDDRVGPGGAATSRWQSTGVASRRPAPAAAALGALRAMGIPGGAGGAAPPATWQAWQHLPGVFDLAGPRHDGRVVAAAAGHLRLIAPDGTGSPFADGPGGYVGSDGPEAYIALSPGLEDATDGCRFNADDLFVLDLGTVPGVVRVDPAGHAAAFASVPAAKTLAGIAFDTVGRFGHRLLVGGPAAHGDGSVLAAVDCRGRVTTVASGLPAFEGGLVVAPGGFGAHGGELVVPDELSGRILAVTPAGDAEELAASGVANGGDIGVESAGVVPVGGAVLVADRGTPGNPHPGTDSVLRLEPAALAAAGVLPGDILVASEGGAVTVDLRCASACTVRTVATGPPTSHLEGHLLALGPAPGSAVAVVATQAPSGRDRGALVRGLLSLLAGAVVLSATLALRARMRRR